MCIRVLCTRPESLCSIFKMVRMKIDDFIEGLVLGLLRQNLSYRKIVKQVKQMGYAGSVATVHRIQHGKGVM